MVFTQSKLRRLKNDVVNHQQALLLLIVAMVERLVAGIQTASRLADASIRQTSYWTNKGFICPIDAEDTYRKYDFLNVVRLWLIRTFERKGCTLEEAVDETDAAFVTMRAPEEVIELETARDEEKKVKNPKWVAPAYRLFDQEWRRIEGNPQLRISGLEMALILLGQEDCRLIPMLEERDSFAWKTGKRLADPKRCIRIVMGDWLVLDPMMIMEMIDMVIPRLKMTAGFAADFIGVSRRQLTYWTDKGIVPEIGGDDKHEPGDGTRRWYDWDGIMTAILLADHMDRGLDLEKAKCIVAPPVEKDKPTFVEGIISSWKEIVDAGKEPASASKSEAPEPYRSDGPLYARIIRAFEAQRDPHYVLISRSQLHTLLCEAKPDDLDKTLARLVGQAVLTCLPNGNDPKFRLLPREK